MPTVQWPRCIATITTEYLSGAGTATWSAIRVEGFTAADAVSFDIRFKVKRAYGGYQPFRAQIQKFDSTSQAWADVGSLDEFSINTSGDAWWTTTRSYTIPLAAADGGLCIFRAQIQYLGKGALPTGSGGVARQWIELDDGPPFTAFVNHLGDFSLDYVPISILYCLPEQDMTASLKQSSQYSTNMWPPYSNPITGLPPAPRSSMAG